MNLVKFELKKIMHKKHIVITLLFFIIINIIKINFDYKKSNAGKLEFNRAYWTVYEKVKGSLNRENMNFVIDNYKNLSEIVDSGNFETEVKDDSTYTGYIYGDMNLFKKLYDDMNYRYNYSKNMQEHIKLSEENIEFYKSVNNTYEILKNKNIKTIYSNRQIESFYDTEGFYNYINYDFSSLLILMLLILGLSSVFSIEKECEMDLLLKTSKIGKVKVANAKILASFIYSMIICLIFFLVDVLVFSINFKLEGPFSKLYSIKEFVFTPLNISILCYCLLNDLLKIIGFFTVSIAIIFFSNIFEKAYSALLFSITTVILFIFSSINLENILFNSLNPIFLLINRNLFVKYRVVNLFNYPIPIAFLHVITNTILIIVLLIITKILYKRNFSFNIKILELKKKGMVNNDVV